MTGNDTLLSSAELFLDMSKAFDKVPHPRLLHSLQAVGVSGPLLAWFKSYLSSRIVLSGLSSSPLPGQSGVPEGSILGPLLFIIYINSLANVHLSPGTTLILYADDILLYRPLYPSSHTCASALTHLAIWLACAHLINPSRSSHLVISRKPCVPITIAVPRIESTWSHYLRRLKMELPHFEYL